MTDTTALTPLGVAFDRLAAEEADAPAVTFRGRTHARRELALRSNQLARRLGELGVGVGDMVTIGLPNGVTFYEVTLAVWKVGAIPQPVSYRLPAPELAALIEVADPKLVVGLDPGGGRPWLAGDEPLDGVDDSPLPPATSPAWKAMTSGGSTGRPKLIVATTPAIVEYVAPAGPLLRIGPRETFLCTGPLYHNGPFLFSMTSLFHGGHIVVMDRFDASASLELVERYRGHLHVPGADHDVAHPAAARRGAAGARRLVAADGLPPGRPVPAARQARLDRLARRRR